MTQIFVDADACPVKEEVYRVAKRYGVQVFVVSNMPLRVPVEQGIESVLVRGRLDAADDWIVEHISEGDIVITADIPLAFRSLQKNAHVLDMRGGVFTEDRIHDAMASREILGQLRDLGTITAGPAPFHPRDRSMFLNVSTRPSKRLEKSEITPKYKSPGRKVIFKNPWIETAELYTNHQRAKKTSPK